MKNFFCTFLIAVSLFYLQPLVAAEGLERCAPHDQKLTSDILPSGPWGKWTVPYRVYLPKGYTPTKKYSVVYFLHGRGGDRFLFDALSFCSISDSMIEQGANPFIVIAPEGQNSYWMNGALTHLRWGDVVTRELIADVENKYSVIKANKGRLIAGISMGGHGAIQLALNYPGIYGAVAAHSPVFRTQEEASKDFYYEFGTGLDYQNRDPFSLMIIQRKKINVPLWIDMGGSDPWLKNTEAFARYLYSQKVQGEYHVADDKVGGHTMAYWRYHFVSYLSWYSKHLFPSF